MTQPSYPPYGPGHRHSSYGSIPPPPPYASIPPYAVPPPKNSALPLIVGGVSAVVLLGALGGGVAIYKWRGKAPGLPVDAKALPAQTKEVGTRLIEATRESNEDVKRVYLASELGSSFCRPGTFDPARRLEGIGSGGSRAAKELLFDKKRLDDLAQLLDCGQLLASHLDSPYEGFVTFEGDDAKPRHVMVTHMKVTEIPTKFGFTRQSFGAKKGFCRTQAEDTNAKVGDSVADRGGECGETSHGAFADGATWFLGDRSALELMAKSVAKPRDELSASVAAIKEAAAQTEGLPVVRLAGNPKSSKEFFAAPCNWAAFQSSAPYATFLEGCFPSKAQERALTEVDAKIRAAAYELDSDYLKAGAMKGNLVFVARDADEAKGLEKDIQEIVSDWKAHLETNDAKLIKETKDRSFTHAQKKFAAVVDTFFAALHKMKVSRSGRTIRIAYEEKLSADDVQELVDADKSTVDKRIATAQVLEAVQAKKAIPQASLAKLVGPRWAAYLLAPPPADLAPPAKVALSTDECRRAQGQLASVKSSEMTTSQARELYFHVKLASCGTRSPEVMPVQRGCLSKFRNAADFMLCAPLPPAPSTEPPESEFGDGEARRAASFGL